jgi:hypothetical protein
MKAKITILVLFAKAEDAPQLNGLTISFVVDPLFPEIHSLYAGNS